MGWVQKSFLIIKRKLYFNDIKGLKLKIIIHLVYKLSLYCK